MPTYQVLRRIPSAHSKEIGRIITRWAFLEWRLKNVAYALLNVTPKQGRVAVREPRATNYVDMLRDLLHLAGIQVSVDLVDYQKLLEVLAGHRDRLAHGIWLKHPDFKDPVLQLVKGKWQPNPQKPKAKRVIDPEGALIQAEELRQFVPLIDQAAKVAGQLEIQVSVALRKLPAG